MVKNLGDFNSLYFTICTILIFFSYFLSFSVMSALKKKTIYKDTYTTSVFAVTVFELSDASGDFCGVQSACTALLVQSQVLQYQAAEGRGLMDQSRAARVASLLLLEDVNSKGRVKGKQLQKLHVQPQGGMVIQAVRLWPLFSYQSQTLYRACKFLFCNDFCL